MNLRNILVAGSDSRYWHRRRGPQPAAAADEKVITVTGDIIRLEPGRASRSRI